jgi:hypothetical protein
MKGAPRRIRMSEATFDAVKELGAPNQKQAHCEAWAVIPNIMCVIFFLWTISAVISKPSLLSVSIPAAVFLASLAIGFGLVLRSQDIRRSPINHGAGEADRATRRLRH